ncbi:MAG TPA: hypothetical protein VHF07_00735, partial [Nitrospiraceae bacterium]|nr:hypothetical protein [Nitrospiraceae bacterium]
EHDHVLTVTVIHGTVEVGTSGPVSASIQQLTTGQQVSAGVDGLGIPRTVDPDDFTAWTARRLRVTNVPLSDVIEELQRYHTGFIWIWNPAVRRIRVTGIYDLSDPGRTLTVLAGTLPIRMDRLADRLVILR